MIFEFGDIIDCREAPKGHFLLILGTNKKDEVMYYMITSKTYKVFRDLLVFFNLCASRGYGPFIHNFKEEKGNTIYPTGNLSDAFFIDRHFKYNGHLEVDSMVLINQNPITDDRAIISQWEKEKIAKYCTRLDFDDSEKLIRVIQLSKNIAKSTKKEINRNYNAWRNK